MSRRSRLECKIEKLFKDIGTISFDFYSELGMMLDENDVDKIIRGLKELERKKKIFITVKGRSILLDYIGF